jgi:hypothetical protein
MTRILSLAAVLLIALSSLALAGTASPSNGADSQNPQTSQSERSLRFWHIREQVRILRREKLGAHRPPTPTREAYEAAATGLSVPG